MILKIFSDCCICFAILAAGPVQCQMPLLVPALICGLAAGIATFFEGKGWSALRRLCSLLPLSCLLLAENGGHGFVLAVPAVYTAITIARGRLELEYSSYRYFFVRSLVLLGVVGAVAYIWNFLTQLTSEQTLQLNGMAIVRYALVHLLCGVVLQRQLRLGVGYRAEGGRRQMSMLLGTAAAVAVGFAAAEPLLRQGLAKIMRAAFSLLLTPFVFVVELVMQLIANAKRTESDKRDFDEFLAHMQNVMTEGMQQNQGQPGEPAAPTEFDPMVIWAILVGILLLIAALLLLRSFRKQVADAPAGELTGRLVSKPKKKPAPLSNRARVRQMYRDFLRLEQDLGLKLQPSDTSADVLCRIHRSTHRPSAEQLRQVYLLARYDDRQNITRSQVEQAKQAVKGTRSTKNSH